MYSNSYNRNFNPDKLSTLGELAHMLTLNKYIVPTTMSMERLILNGCKGIKLEAVFLNGAFYSSVLEVEYFCCQLAAFYPCEWQGYLLRTLGLPIDKVLIT